MKARYLIPLGLSVISAAMPATADFQCTGTLEAVTIEENIQVANAVCRLQGTNVDGNVKLYSGGALIANGATIKGNIQGDDAMYVQVNETHVDGDVQLDGLVSDNGGTISFVRNSRIGGNIQLDDNRVAFDIHATDVNGDIQLVGNFEPIDTHHNQVDGDVQAFENLAPIDITDNVIDGNLQCKENDPPPTGGNNAVTGNKEDQCADLQARTTASPVAPDSEGGSPIVPGDDTEGSGGGGSFSPLTLPALLLLALFTIRRRHS